MKSKSDEYTLIVNVILMMNKLDVITPDGLISYIDVKEYMERIRASESYDMKTEIVRKLLDTFVKLHLISEMEYQRKALFSHDIYAYTYRFI